MRISAIIIISVALFFTCKDNVKEFSGFTQKELEYLLAADDIKVWERVSIKEGGDEIVPDDCGMDNYLIFMQGSLGAPKPLLYVYNPLICDSTNFCIQHPDFCQSDTTLCNSDPEFCSTLGDGVLYIGTWYAKAPFIQNDRSDTLIFEINKKKESIYVTSITSLYATFQYKQRTGSNGGTITEEYKFIKPGEE